MVPLLALACCRRHRIACWSGANTSTEEQALETAMCGKELPKNAIEVTVRIATLMLAVGSCAICEYCGRARAIFMPDLCIFYASAQKRSLCITSSRSTFLYYVSLPRSINSQLSPVLMLLSSFM